MIEKLFFRRGEVFVSAVMTGNLDRIGHEQLTDIVLEDLSANRPPDNICHHLPGIIAAIVHNLLAHPKDSTHHYLQRLANSYTLLSFPTGNAGCTVRDPQTDFTRHSVARYYCSTATFRGTTEEDQPLRRFTGLLLACHDAGIELRVTPGIIKEIVSHMYRSLACSRVPPASWRGRAPYLYKQYLRTGKPSQKFAKWLSLFRGEDRPEDDVAQFLYDVFSDSTSRPFRRGAKSQPRS